MFAIRRRTRAAIHNRGWRYLIISQISTVAYPQLEPSVCPQCASLRYTHKVLWRLISFAHRWAIYEKRDFRGVIVCGDLPIRERLRSGLKCFYSLCRTTYLLYYPKDPIELSNILEYLTRFLACHLVLWSQYAVNILYRLG